MQFDDEGVPLNGQTHGAVVTPTGLVIPAFGRSGTGWRVWSPCGEEVVIDAGQYIESVDVVIDPGHGGPDEPGAVGPNGLRESDLNLAVAERVATGLRAAGYSVVMTRIHDDRIPIVTRAEIALALDPLAFVSIHHNGGVTEPSDSPGTEMYHQIDDPESKRLAGLMLEEARAALAQYDAPWVSMSDAGAMTRPDAGGDDYYGVLRRPAGVASVLAELAYLSNEPEAEMLERADVQEALAGSIVRAIERFTTSDDPGSGFVDDPIFRGYGPSGAGRTEGCVDPALQ
jgi:N-acetylmuramoyl-L-alanine amidase